MKQMLYDIKKKEQIRKGAFQKSIMVQVNSGKRGKEALNRK